MNIQLHEPVLITGGTGFVGSHLYEYLLSKQYSNIHLTTLHNLDMKSAELFSQAQTHQLDLSNKDSVFELVQSIKPRWVFHLASLAAVGGSFENSTNIQRMNAQVQENMLEAVKLFAPDCRVLSVGSAEMYGKSEDESEIPVTESHVYRPINPYAVSKIYQDSLAYMYFSVFNLDVIRARPFNHIGERQTNQFVVASFAEQIAKIEKGLQTEIYVGNLESTRDFTDVKDVVRAYHTLMEAGVAGEAYNIGSGKGITIQSVLDTLCSFSKTDISIKLDTNRLRPSDIPVIIANTDKIKQLGWQAEIPTVETLQRILGYWRETV